MKQSASRAPAASVDTPTDIDLDRFIPAMLLNVVNRFSSSATRTFKRRLKIGLLDVRVMSIVSLFPGSSGTHIAETLDLDKSAVSRTLRSLHKRRLVSLSDGPNGTRTAMLTPTGRTMYSRALELMKAREELLFANFSPADRETLVILLRRLLAAMPRLDSFAND